MNWNALCIWHFLMRDRMIEERADFLHFRATALKLIRHSCRLRSKAEWACSARSTIYNLPYVRFSLHVPRGHLHFSGFRPTLALLACCRLPMAPKAHTPPLNQKESALQRWFCNSILPWSWADVSGTCISHLPTHHLICVFLVNSFSVSIQLYPTPSENCSFCLQATSFGR
jgi:hypothetical protein